MFLKIGVESLPVLTDTRVTHSVLHPITKKQPLPPSTNTVQIVGISNESQEVLVSEPIPFPLGPLRDICIFLLSSSAPTHLLGWDFLEKYHAGHSFFQKEEIILEFDSSHQNHQPGKLNDPFDSFICSVSDSSRVDFGNTDHLSLLNQPPPSLWAKSPTDISNFKEHPFPSRFK